MYRPVLVNAPSILPVSLAEVKAALRVGGTDFDNELSRLIGSAVAQYDGWSGLLGVCLVEQTWRVDFDGFCDDMYVPLGPSPSITSISWRAADGQIFTVDDNQYVLLPAASGRNCIRYKRDFAQPSDLYEIAPVSVEFTAGWPVVDEKPTTPDDIRSAIILNVLKNFDETAGDNALQVERIERDLMAKYRAPIF